LEQLTTLLLSARAALPLDGPAAIVEVIVVFRQTDDFPAIKTDGFDEQFLVPLTEGTAAN
jgi:hypothetical protein